MIATPASQQTGSATRCLASPLYLRFIVSITLLLLWQGCSDSKSSDDETPLSTQINVLDASRHIDASTEFISSTDRADCNTGTFQDANGTRLYGLMAIFGRSSRGGNAKLEITANCPYSKMDFHIFLAPTSRVSCLTLQVALREVPLCEGYDKLGSLAELEGDMDVLFEGSLSEANVFGKSEQCPVIYFDQRGAGPRQATLGRPADAYYGLKPESYVALGLEFNSVHEIAKFYAVPTSESIECPETFKIEGLSQRFDAFWGNIKGFTKALKAAMNDIPK